MSKTEGDRIEGNENIIQDGGQQLLISSFDELIALVRDDKQRNSLLSQRIMFGEELKKELEQKAKRLEEFDLGEYKDAIDFMRMNQQDAENPKLHKKNSFFRFAKKKKQKKVKKQGVPKKKKSHLPKWFLKLSAKIKHKKLLLGAGATAVSAVTGGLILGGIVVGGVVVGVSAITMAVTAAFIATTIAAGAAIIFLGASLGTIMVLLTAAGVIIILI